MKFPEQYHYPLGQDDRSIFNSNAYKSLIRCNDRLIYTVARTGVGHDGRSGTYHTHHIVFDESNFVQINNDIRHLDAFVFEMPHTLRSMNALTIHSIPEEMLPIPSFPQIDEIQKALREKKKVAILNKKAILSDRQAIISSLKPEERVITWCNCVPDPDWQTAFDFIGCDHHVQHDLQKNWKVFDWTDKVYCE